MINILNSGININTVKKNPSDIYRSNTPNYVPCKINVISYKHKNHKGLVHVMFVWWYTEEKWPFNGYTLRK
jgi:hypothetical protein